jgi:hypothetical protein
MNYRFTPPLVRLALLTAIAIAVAFLGSACGLLGDDDDNGSGGSTSSGKYTVLQAAIGTEINDQQQLTSQPARAFPENTSQVYAVIVLQGLEVGDEVTGRWYQLSTQDAPPEGSFVSEAGVTMTQENVTADGAGRVALNLGSDTGALPAGDWVVRVYVNGEFVRTMGFVITPLLNATGQQQPQQPQQPNTPPEQPGPTGSTPPEGQPTPEGEPTQPADEGSEIPETYEVQPGDTLTIIAEQFRPQDEPVESYAQRIRELNNLDAGTILFVGQVLQMPQPQP